MKKAKKRKAVKHILLIFWVLILVILNFILINKINAQRVISKEIKMCNTKKDEIKKVANEENPRLKAQKQKYEERQNIKSSILTPEDEDNIFRLGKIVAAEGGGVDSKECKERATEASITSDLWQQYIAYVVLNRVYQKGYPDTIEGVFYQEGQYAQTSIEKYEKDFYTENSLKNARVAYLNYLYNEMPVPRNMVFQAEFEQGDVILHVGNTYFGASPSMPSN